MRWALWAAVSSLPQAKKISLESQLEQGRQHVAKWQGEVVAELVVPGESRSIVLFEDACRRIKAYAQLKELIDQRAIDVLCYLDRSRLGRKASLSMAVVELCHEAAILTYDLDSPPANLESLATSHDDMLVGAIKSVGAQQEVAKLNDRHRSGMLGRTKRGEMPAALPYGYAEHYTPEGVRIIEIDELAARWVRQMAEWYLGGIGTPAIAERLNAANAPTVQGGAWHHIQVRSVLFRAWRYAGYSEINIHSPHKRPYLRAPGNWPAIISEATAERIYAERDARSINRRLADTPYTLSGICWCVECNRPISIHTSPRPGGRSHTELRCPQGAHPKYCMTYRRAIAGLQNSLAVLDVHSLPEDDEDRIAPLRNRIESHRAAIKHWRTSLLRADDAHVSGVMDAERYRRQVENIQARIEYEESQIINLEMAIENEKARGTRRQRIEDLSANGLAMLDNPDTAKANAYFRQRVRVWVRRAQVVVIDYL